MNYTPEQIFEEYKAGIAYKSTLGTKGLYEQNRINERFFIGDQWYGANCGNERPLVRHNVIKRIGDYKMSHILSNSVNINYSADGVPNTFGMADGIKKRRSALSTGEQIFGEKRDNDEIVLIMSALNDYQKVTAERVGFDMIAEQALRDAYIGGSSVIYTYWNPNISTGLYADDSRTTQIKGDIECECINIENVYFGDPYEPDVQNQPYIIIATRTEIDAVKRSAMLCGKGDISDLIIPDNMSGSKVTVLTRFWKEWNESGTDFTIYAQQAVKGAVVRDKWDIGVRMYPLAVFNWERRKNCAYGDSEITYIIPNQIAINRMITSGVWSTMSTGMPTMVVNGDIIDGDITNDPGQIIKVYGDSQDVENAIKFITPPDISANFSGVIQPLIENTLAQNGAGSAAIGDAAATNTSAIIELKTASRMPLKLLEKRYFAFLEEISKIWAEFWITQYDDRRIKIRDENGVWYLDFKGERYRDLIISVKAEATQQDADSNQKTVAILDNLLDKGIITPMQYLKRMPSGTIPDINRLIDEQEEKR